MRVDSAVKRPESAPRGVHDPREDFEREVREALHRAYDLAFLQNHPLTRFVGTSAGPRRAPLGQALQEALYQAIESLRGEAAGGGARSGRSHALLTLRYVEALSVGEVCQRLGISTREYYREHQKGTEAVVSVLRQTWGLDGPRETPPEESVEVVLRFPRRAVLPGAPPAAPLSSFVGREREHLRLGELLESARLITLLGPPGTGKTRLAQEAATRLRSTFAEAVSFVSLAAVEESALVIPSIARALDLDEEPGVPAADTLREALGSKRFLLILDNVEQVVDAAPEIVDLLGKCPGLRIVVTSRVRLSVRGERVLPVPPLAAPEPDRLGSGVADALAIARSFDAVRLFEERAREVDPDFALTTATAPVVAEICRRLDGLPLAIELAAARIDALSPRVLLDGLSGRRGLDLLASGARDLPPRQRTLRDAIAWSYELLSEDDRITFRRVAGFVGGFALDAARAVLDPDETAKGLAPVSGETLDRLEALVRRSLLRRDLHGDGTPRFEMLETLREFGRERLAQSGEGDAVEARRAAYFLDLAREASRELRRAEKAEWYLRLDAELGNLRQALAWHRTVDPVRGLELATSLARYWHVRGSDDEGVRWIQELLPAVDPESVDAAGAVLALAMLGRCERGWRGELERALAIFRAADDRLGTIEALLHLSWRVRLDGDHAGTRPLLLEASDLAEQASESGLRAKALLELASLESAVGNAELAWRLCEESLALWRESGAEVAGGEALAYLGNFARMRGDYALAERLFAEALDGRRALGHRGSAAWLLGLMGNLARLQGQPERARAILLEGLAMAVGLGGGHHISIPLIFLAVLEIRAGAVEKGVQLAAAVLEHDSTIYQRFDPDEREDFDAALLLARQALGDAAFEQARELGRHRPIQAVLDETLGGLSPV